MSLGKYRHFSRASTATGHFVILAIDHRANLRQSLEKQGPIRDQDFRDFKLQVVAAAAPQVSAVLADPGYALGSLIAGRIFSGGLLSPLEVTDYDVHPSQRELQWIPGWSVEKVKRMGGDGVKLLIPFHPQLPSASAKEKLVQQVVAECARHDIPLYLEPIACSPAPGHRLSSVQQRQITVEMAARCCALGADILKLQLPAHEDEWEPTCRQLAEVCTAPWALLSGGVDFDTYCRQAELACFHGASGVIVGRAVWSEATELQGEARSQFLAEVVPLRLSRLAQICATGTAPWMKRFPLQSPTLDWYQSY
ncbi:tagatose 1,6-diphosphate aldolase [bacterium]|nr:tagatose 1,6-diphosphate aldolase [bacterium]